MYCHNYLLNINGSQSNPIRIKGVIENLQVSNMFLPSNIILQTRWSTKMVLVILQDLKTYTLMCLSTNIPSWKKTSLDPHVSS